MTASRWPTSGCSWLSASLRSLPRLAKPSPNSFRFSFDAALVRAREHLEDVVDLDGQLRLRHRDRCSGPERLLGVPALDLEVLEAERGYRAHEVGRVRRQRLDRLVELHVDDRVQGAVARLRGADAADVPDPGPADQHAVGRDQPGGVRNFDIQVVGRDEREPVVGVVREVDGDHEDQDRDRADQDRVAERFLSASSGHDRRR